MEAKTYVSSHLVGQQLIRQLGIPHERVTSLTLHLNNADSYVVVHYLEDVEDKKPLDHPVDVTTINSTSGFRESTLQACVQKSQRYSVEVTDMKAICRLFGMDDQRVVSIMFVVNVGGYPRVSARLMASQEQCQALGELVKVAR